MTGDKKPEFSDKELKVHIRHVLLHEFLRGSKPSAVIKELYELYGDEIMCQRTIKRWFVRFGKGDFSLLDKPKLGKRKLDKDRFTEFIGNNYSISNRDLADAFDVSPETIRKYRAIWGLNPKGEEAPQRVAVTTDNNNTTDGANDTNIAIVSANNGIPEINTVFNAADTNPEDIVPTIQDNNSKDILPVIEDNKESTPLISLPEDNATSSNKIDTTTNQNTTEVLENDGLSDSSE